jgi:hypothetical protein
MAGILLEDGPQTGYGAVEFAPAELQHGFVELLLQSHIF